MSTVSRVRMVRTERTERTGMVISGAREWNGAVSVNIDMH